MPVEIHIRPIMESDAAAITALSGQLGYSLTTEEARKNIAEILSNKTHAAFIACTGQTVVGWIHVFRAVLLESKPFIEIGGLVIDENYRRQGIGKLLINKAKEWAKEKDMDKLRVRCNRKRTEAHQFYMSLGFTESKEQKIFDVTVL